MRDYSKLIYRHVDPAKYLAHTTRNDLGYYSTWERYFEQISFGLDIFGNENLYQLGHAVRLKDHTYPDMYVVMVGGDRGNSDNRGYDPTDATIREGS